MCLPKPRIWLYIQDAQFFKAFFSDIYITIRRNQPGVVNTQVAATKHVQQELIEEELR